MKKSLIQFAGWAGVVLILVSYAGLTLGIFSAGNAWYQLLNLLGAIGIIFETKMRRDFQPMTLNVIWAIVALYGLLAIIR